MGVDQGSADKELMVEKVTKDQLKFVHVVSKHDLTAGPLILDIDNPYFMEPEYYERNQTSTAGRPGSGQFKIHPSRVVRLVGLEAPDPTLTDGWGDSVLQVLADAILAAGTVSQGVASLVNEAKIDVIKVPDLTASLTSKEYETRLTKRFTLAANMKSIFHMLLLDNAEEWERIEANFSQLPELIDVYLQIASGAADIPATRMLSQSPKGMQSTGQSDTRNYYDRISSEQKTDIQPVISRLDEVLIRSALGGRPEEVFYEWRPLWQLDATEKATIGYQKAQAFQIDVQSGLFDANVLQKARENQLIEDGTYPGLEDLLLEFEAEQEAMANQPEPEIDPATGLPKVPDPNADPNVDPANVDPEATAAADMAKRARSAPTRKVKKDKKKKTKGYQGYQTTDTSPRSLYVYRPVQNAKEIIAWAKAQGFKSVTAADSMHVTLFYCRAEVDWSKAGEAYGQDDKGIIRVAPGGMRIMDTFGEGATVLVFTASSLSYRHQDLMRNLEGSTWDYPDYQPHIAITYNKGDVDLETVEPYKGEIILGPECFDPVDDNYTVEEE